MRFLAALTVLATATVNVAVALPGLNNAQASCKTHMDPCVNMTIAAAHGNTCCPPLICGANGRCL